MLTVNALHKNFGPIAAVRGISFEVAKGDVLGFLGPNGAGKSTTMRMVTGFLKPSGGTAVIDGCDILEQSVAARRRIGYLPENAPVYRDATVHHFLNFIADVRGFRGAEQRRRVDRVMAICKLEGVRHQSVDTLSKGYKQRVCFAQAVLHDPPLLIMDEPTDGLDPNQKAIVRSMILEMAATKAIVISTHILEEVDAVCNRAIIISGGRIVAQGTPSELKRRSPGYGAVSLTLTRVPDGTQAELEALPAVARVETTPDAGFIVYPRQPDALLQEIMELSRRQQWSLSSISVSEGRLEDTFRALTTLGEKVS